MRSREMVLVAVLAIGALPFAADAAPNSQTPWPAGKVVGWRGDGTGQYPDAKPPTVWYKKENGESKNILWAVKLPCYSWATPVIVGDKIFVRSEPYDLICLDKRTGKLLWIRSHPPFVALTDAEKKANPAFKEIEPLVAELQRLNDAFVANDWSAELYKAKHDLQKKIDELTAKADKKYTLPKDMWNESWCGYTGQTPCSDGKFIYFNSCSGVTAAYDLNGNKKWAIYQQLQTFEHGNSWACGLAGDKLLLPIIPFNKKFTQQEWDVAALDKATGKPVWYQTYKGDRSYLYEIIPFKAGGVDYAIAWSNFIRVSDGKSFFSLACTYGGFVIQGNVAFFPIADNGFGWYAWQAQANGDLRVSEVKRIGLPVEDKSKVYDAMTNYYLPSPLVHEDLVYQLSNWGKLVVIDIRKGAVVYSKMLPFDMKNPKHRHTYGCGICASPALAGKYIYLTDNAGCTIVIEPGREYKQLAKNNIDYTMPSGWEPNHWEGTRHEVTLASPIFDGNRIYLRGEQFLYCIGEK